jgi:hypothetical protein
MSSFLRVAIRCCVFIGWALIAAVAAHAAGAQAPVCTDEPTKQVTEIMGVPTGNDWWGPMTFKDGGVVPGYGRVIYATGQLNSPSSTSDTNILDNSALGFENFLKTASVKPGALVVLHSPGGSVEAGFAIGEAIRRNSLRTMVGQPQTPNKSTPLTALATAAPTKGFCASACTLAFLGGIYRSVPNGSVYGVHAAESAEFSQAASLAGIFYQGEKTAAQTSAYLEEMGIDPSWLTVADQCAAGYGRILFMSPEQMARTRVTTAFTTSWTLSDEGGTIVLAGINSESSALPGYNDDLILGCVGTPRRVLMFVDYLPEAYHAGQAVGAARPTPTAFIQLVSHYSLSGFKANSVANNQPMVLNIDQPGSFVLPRVGDLHHVTSAIAVTPGVVDLLKGSDTLQFSFTGQLAPVGQVNFDLTNGKQEISDYIADCQ